MILYCLKADQCLSGSGETQEGQEGGTTKGREEPFGDDGYVHWLDCGDGFTCVYMSELIQSYTVNMYGLMYVIISP